MRQVGERVGAIRNADDKNVYMFGWGTYEGDKVPPTGSPIQYPNPCIKLDSGKQVYGFECWWGPEEKIAKMIGGRQVVIVEPQWSN